MILLLCVWITGRGADSRTSPDMKPGYPFSARLVTSPSLCCPHAPFVTELLTSEQEARSTFYIGSKFSHLKSSSLSSLFHFKRSLIGLFACFWMTLSRQTLRCIINLANDLSCWSANYFLLSDNPGWQHESLLRKPLTASNQTLFQRRRCSDVFRSVPFLLEVGCSSCK